MPSKIGIWGACLAFLAGCSGAVVEFEESAFPKPLVEVIDLDVGVQLSEELTSYVHIEEIEMYGDWEIKLGLVQPLLFHNTLGSMFMTVTDVENATEPHPELDAVLVPTIVDFQMSIPSQTRSTFYEVWIKYTMRLYDNDGQLVAEWTLPAYGKSNKEDYGVIGDLDEPALEDATMLALRDASASLSLRFAHEPPVKSWLASRGETLASDSTEPTAGGEIAADVTTGNDAGDGTGPSDTSVSGGQTPKAELQSKAASG